MRDGWEEISLEDLETSGVIKLGRGDVISKKDMEADPGPNPVYSSAENKNGMIGKYDKFMFDEELITWSVDGGGHIFYRPKHKFSVTNIGGWLRILDDKVFSYQFLTYALQRLHKQHSFDWQHKAHPSVIRKLYTRIPLPSLPEQKRIVDLISSVDSYIEALQQQSESAKKSRNAVLHELMSQAFDENRKPLIELAKLQRGHDLPTQDRIEGSIPVVASNGVVGFHNTHKAIGPGVVTGRSGTIGKVIYIDDDYWPLNTTLYVIDFKGNLPKFVALVLETLKLENYAGGSTVPSLDRNVLSQVPVPYPSIKEQERIVGIIQSLDEVLAKSEHAISQAKILRTGLLSDLLSGTHEIPASYDKVIGAA